MTTSTTTAPTTTTQAPADNLLSSGGFIGRGFGKLASVEMNTFGSTAKISNCNIPDLPRGTEKHATVASRQGLISCGGTTGGLDVTNKCWQLKSKSEWIPMKDMKQNRFRFTLSELNTTLVAFGGTITDNVVEFLNLEGGEWNVKRRDTISSTLRTLNSHCAVNLNDEEIILIGGFLNGRLSAETHIFSIKTMSLTSGPTMNTIRYGHGCTITENMGSTVIHVAGGYNGSKILSSIESMKLTENKWKVSSIDLPMPISQFQLVKSNLPNRPFYAVGGYGASRNNVSRPTYSTIYALNNQNNVLGWKLVGNLVTPRHGHATTNIPITNIPGCQ